MVVASAIAVALPLYSWPMPGVWDPVYETVSNNPDMTFNIIVNPDSGPGSFPPNSDYRGGVAKLNSYDNVNLFGYVRTGFTGRAVDDVIADVKNYAQWESYAGADLHLDGIFVDEAPDNNYDNGVDYMADVGSRIKSVMPSGGDMVWTNPGCVVKDEYYDHADVVTAFEDTYSYWHDPGRPTIQWHKHNQSAVMITEYDGGEPGIHSEVDTLIYRGFHSTFMWGSLVGYNGYSTVWGQFSEALTDAKQGS